MFKAVTSLQALIRWCVTGTPIQNSLDDLASLIKFLRYPLLEDTGTFRRYMYIAKKAKVIGNSRKPDYEKLKLLLGQICLRRSTSVILTSLNCTFVVIRPRLSEKERIDYKMLVTSCCRAIEACLASRPTRGGNNAVLTALLRLRIFCNTGMSDIGDNFMPDENISLLQQGGDAMCTECNADVLFSGAADSTERQKRHQFRVKKCHKCAQWDSSSINAENVSEDPQDLKNIDIDELNPHAQTDLGQYSILNQSAPEAGIYPSKMRALVDDVKEHYSSDKRQVKITPAAILLLTSTV
jgi:SWI/SNF-related matrix-associated actin-dependent regulator of chromatin subfamily A3